MQISIANRWEMRVCCGTVTDRSLREIVGNHTFAGGVEPRPYAVHTVIRYGKTGKGLTERHIGRSLRGRGDPAMGNVEKCAVSRNDTQVVPYGKFRRINLLIFICFLR